MSAKRKQKFYVVWSGVEPGIYNNWEDCRRQVHQYKGAKFKSFPDRATALQAFHSDPSQYIAKRPTLPFSSSLSHQSKLYNPPSDHTDNTLSLPPEVCAEAWAVDAACSGNPGKMEYRCVDLRTGTELFHYGPIWGTNNIGEFLAIVHALALIEQKGGPSIVYSDSRNALLWVRKRKCATKLPLNTKTEKVHTLISRAETWLQNHIPTTQLIKWETHLWGEIPADFGRK